MLAEDDVSLGELLTTIIGRMGIECTSAASVDEAWSALTSSNFDLCILDYRLAAGSSGLEIYRRLLEHDIRVPAILVTGFGDEQLLTEALRLGIRDFLPKDGAFLTNLPISIKRVLADIEKERKLQENERLRLSMLEVHHRVKNSFQIVNSLLNMELRKKETLTAQDVKRVISYVQGLALIHDMLTDQIKDANSAFSSQIDGCSLGESLCISLSQPEKKLVFSGEGQLIVSPRTASSLAVIITELVMNAIKYGEGSTIKVKLGPLRDGKGINSDRGILEVENEINTSEDNAAESSKEIYNRGGNTGTSLLDFLAKTDMGSRMERQQKDNLYIASISFPLKG